MPQLPIEDVMPALLASVRDHSQVILKAAPGAGKSTRFPLQLLKNNIVSGKILMLEPRRLAAKNIARYLANQLGESVGQRVGYRIRGESKAGENTRLEIVTEGIMTRMIQQDPELSGVDMVIFDEFHERSLHADTGLAFCLEIQEALRDDLRLVVMSATLDQLALSSLMPEAAYIESQGKVYPVEHQFCPLTSNGNMVGMMAKQIRRMLAEETGSVLAFLPGVRAIKQLEERLSDLTGDVQVCPLYGQLNFPQQQQAIEPAGPGRRKVVLATNIAETSLTIEGIRIVIDSGFERVARFDPKSGVTRLEQVRVAQSSAVQRAGRAGRTQEGICVHLYSENQMKQQPTVPVPEILQSDLASLAGEVALWGASDAGELHWLDTPPHAALSQAKGLLNQLGIMDSQGQLTAIGRRTYQLGLEPRLGAMMLWAKETATGLDTALAVTALLEEREPNTLDFQHSVFRFKQGKHHKQKQVMQRAMGLAAKLGSPFSISQVDESRVGGLLAQAFPDRISQKRAGQSGRFLMANGHGVSVDETQILSDEPYIVAIELMRTHGESSTLFCGCAIDIRQLESEQDHRFVVSDEVDWDEKKGRLTACERVKLGELLIRSKDLPSPPKEKMTQALLTYVARQGLQVLNWTDKASTSLARIRCGREWMPEHTWPAMDEQSLIEQLETWLSPYLVGVSSVKQLQQVDLHEALMAYLGWPLNQEIDHWLPTHYTLPTGSKKRIRYEEGKSPVLSVRMQEMFGESASPVVAQGKITLVLELLSPAQRPLQRTQDLAGFWKGSYRDVQKEMKGRYPKHVWPDDPANHVATTKTKRQLKS